MVSQPRGCRGPDSAVRLSWGELPHPLAVTQEGEEGEEEKCPRAPPWLSSAERVAASAACLQMQALQDPLNCVLVQKRL